MPSIPCVNSMISWADRSMSSGVASSRDIDRLRTAKNRLASNGVVTTLHPATADKVDFSPQDGLQFLLHLCVIEQPPASIGEKCDQHVNIAIRSEILA